MKCLPEFEGRSPDGRPEQNGSRLCSYHVALRRTFESVTRFRRVGREAALIAVGQFTAVLGGVVGVRLLTGYMAPSAYGELALGMTLATLSQQVVFGPLANAVVRFFAPSRESGELGIFFASVRWLYLRAVVIAAAVGVLGYAAADSLASGHEMLALVATAYALVLGCNAALDAIQNAARQRAVVALHSGLGQWLRFLCAVAAVSLLHQTGTVAIGGYTIAALGVFVSQTFFLGKKFPGDLARPEIPGQAISDLTKKMWVYAWPFAVWAPFTWVQLSADRWALEHYTDTAHVGLYQAMYQVGYTPVTLACGFFVNLLTPILFDRAGDGMRDGRLQTARRLNNSMVLIALCLTAVAVAVGLMFHERVCAALLAPGYRSESQLLPWFLFSGGIFAAGQVLSLNSITGMNTRALLYPKIGTAVAGALMTLALTRVAGLHGTVIASVLFSVTYFVWLACLNGRNVVSDVVAVVFSKVRVATSEER